MAAPVIDGSGRCVAAISVVAPEHRLGKQNRDELIRRVRDASAKLSGRLGEVLEEISVYYAKALRDAIKAVTGMIEPIMIILMGSVVGFIAMAIILPIFKLSQLVN